MVLPPRGPAGIRPIHVGPHQAPFRSRSLPRRAPFTAAHLPEPIPARTSVQPAAWRFRRLGDAGTLGGGLFPPPPLCPDRRCPMPMGPEDRQPTVLLVEDDEVTRLAMACTLAREGYLVLTAATGHDAVGMLWDASDPI